MIETEKPHIGQIGAMMDEIREVIPNAKLVYNNSPSFNWTLNFRQQVFDSMVEDGKDVTSYDRDDLMDVKYDDTDLAREADEKIRTFQSDAAQQAGIFHHLITLPTYHTAALSTDNLAKEYFGDKGMLGYVEGVQRKEIREGIACVKHQNMAGSDMGDDHKEYFAGEAALKAAGEDNTMNQFNLAQFKKGASSSLFYCSTHFEGLPPHSSHSLPGSKFASPPQEPVIGFFPKSTPTDITAITAIKTRKIKPFRTYLYFNSLKLFREY